MIGLAAGLVVVLVAAATAWFLLRPKNHELGGSMSVFDTDYMSSNAGSSCSGKGGYSDINSGGQVTVKDGKGTTLAVGRLGQGKLLSLDEVANQNGLTTTTTKRSTSSSSDNSPIVCQFPVIVTDIPDADFYRVEIGRRSPVEYSKADLESQSWKLSLTLGP